MYENLEQEMRELKKALAVGFLAVLLGGWVLTLCSCNTISGLGTDVSDAAKWTMDKVDYGFSGKNRD